MKRIKRKNNFYIFCVECQKKFNYKSTVNLCVKCTYNLNQKSKNNSQKKLLE